jgi:hypothetical protein
MTALDQYPVIAAFRAEHPIVADFLDRIYAQHVDSINSLNVAAIEQALQQIEQSQGPRFDRAAAVAYLRCLFDSMAGEFPVAERNIGDFVALGYFTHAGNVPTSTDWNACDQVGREDDVTAIVDRIPEDQQRRILSQALYYLMPSLLDVIHANDPFKTTKD